MTAHIVRAGGDTPPVSTVSQLISRSRPSEWVLVGAGSGQ
jgi:hypothetical protein